jgi:peptidoglycan/xylan/chitin deacetylase (PgdA/CDA1 family)
MALKGLLSRQQAFAIVREAHKRVLMKPLPDKVAIYFHALDDSEHGAFRDCMVHFKDLGYRFVSASQYASTASHGRQLFVSFDDNYKSWHEALDLMTALEMQATFYVNTLPFRETCPEPDRLAFFDRIDHAGKGTSMTRAELRDLVQAGHEIGCHSHSHFNLAQLERGQWDQEIVGCRQKLEDLTGKPIEHFAYPYGMRRFFSEPLRDYCRSLGFKTIATAIPGRLQGGSIDPFNLHRTRWNLARPLAENIEDIRIDGRLFEALTGRSAVG